MGRAQNHKAARKLAARIASGQPGFVYDNPTWLERLPLIGEWIRNRRNRKNAEKLQLHNMAVEHAKKRVAKKIVDFR